MIGFSHGWHSRCEGVGWYSGREHEWLHLMHDIDISYNSKKIVWNVIDCLYMPLHMHFRWGVTLVGRLSTGLCSLRRGTPFHVQRLSRETALSRGSFEKKAEMWL